MTLRMRFALSLVVSALAIPAFAQSTIFTTSAAFLANVQAGSYTETFTGGGVVTAAAPSFSGGSAPFGYTITSGTGGALVYRNGTFIGNNTANQSLIVTFTSGSPTAIGGNFFITNSADAFVSAPVTITLSDGTTTTFTPTSATDYRGFISSVPITSLVLAIPGTNNFNTIDNFTVGLRVPAAAAPEPGSLALLGLGAVGGLALRRRRTK